MHVYENFSHTFVPVPFYVVRCSSGQNLCCSNNELDLQVQWLGKKYENLTSSYILESKSSCCPRFYSTPHQGGGGANYFSTPGQGGAGSFLLPPMNFFSPKMLKNAFLCFLAVLYQYFGGGQAFLWPGVRGAGFFSIPLQGGGLIFGKISGPSPRT